MRKWANNSEKVERFLVRSIFAALFKRYLLKFMQSLKIKAVQKLQAIP